MPNTRVEIDLNDVDASGLTTVRLIEGLTIGAEVIAFEPEDSVSAPATVVRIDEKYRLAFLRVDWQSMRKDVVRALVYPTATSLWPVPVILNAKQTSAPMSNVGTYYPRESSLAS